MAKHPALGMSKLRQDAWLKHAEPDDFFEMLTLLSRLYAKKKYDPKLGYRAVSLIEDYPEYVKKKALARPFKNNVPAVVTLEVPFASEGDALGSYVRDEPPADPMDELNELIDNIEL